MTRERFDDAGKGDPPILNRDVRPGRRSTDPSPLGPWDFLWTPPSDRNPDRRLVLFVLKRRHAGVIGCHRIDAILPSPASARKTPMPPMPPMPPVGSPPLIGIVGAWVARRRLSARDVEDQAQYLSDLREKGCSDIAECVPDTTCGDRSDVLALSC